MEAYLEELDSLYRRQNILIHTGNQDMVKNLELSYPLEDKMKKSSLAYYKSFGKNREGWRR